ncbi:MAG TPA: prenyltransferase/squalene oxidase repeat-containing protein, partial [Gemmata sp.]
MSDRPAGEKPPKANKAPRETREAVIRRLEAAEETAQERFFKKFVPAWLVSGAVHVSVLALALIFFSVRNAETKQPDKVLNTTAEKTDEPEEPNLTNDDLGLDSKIEAALPEIERLDQKTVDEKVTMDNVGQPNVMENDIMGAAIPGLDSKEFTTPGAAGENGTYNPGDGGNNGTTNAATAGRSGATKSRLLKEGGGSAESERAVGLGLAWLAKQQKADGGWTYDQGKVEERAAATGMALLPFLAAGVTHKKSKEHEQKNYDQVVHKGLGFLMKLCSPSGASAGKMSNDVYAQAIATTALCEAYGMTKDRTLKPYAQASINYIQRTQGQNGSWGYGNRGNGDTSIVGWQVQALKAAKLSKDLVVDDRVIKNANRFLDIAAAGSQKSMYGYADSAGAAPGTALTAVGLLCRYYISEWGPVHPGMIDGVGGLMKHGPRYPATGKPKSVSNMYYYYYSTQVVHFFEGEDWKTWNE